MPYAVKGETEHGELILRTFETREEAEDHPVKLSAWRRVWIERVDSKPAPPRPSRSCRLPWTIEEPAGKSFTYLRDADGARIASLFGTFEERQQSIEILREHGVLGKGA